MPLTQLEHYLVLTHDLDATRDFYQLALGMHLGPRPSFAFPGYWMYLGDTACIHIAEWVTYTQCMSAAGIGVSTRASGTGPVDHIAFNAVDGEEMKSRLSAQGVAYAVNEVPDFRLTQLFVHDPNGLKVEINVRHPPSAAAG